MALVIEDGSGVAGANSYITLVNAQAYIDLRGYTTTLTEGMLLRAVDALAGVRFRGLKYSVDNPLPWPRGGVYDNEGFYISEGTIPQQMIDAQVWAAYYIVEGSDPSAVSTPAIVSEIVDVIEVEYAVSTGETTAVSILSLPNVRDALRSITRSAGSIGRA